MDSNRFLNIHNSKCYRIRKTGQRRGKSPIQLQPSTCQILVLQCTTQTNRVHQFRCTLSPIQRITPFNRLSRQISNNQFRLYLQRLQSNNIIFLLPMGTINQRGSPTCLTNWIKSQPNYKVLHSLSRGTLLWSKARYSQVSVSLIGALLITRAASNLSRNQNQPCSSRLR